ncbi:MAG: proline dehydrogenase family protein [Phycisphaerales bacterium]|nr:proline dehydrogenase family protein [Phycisphaerales bacterium]
MGLFSRKSKPSPSPIAANRLPGAGEPPSSGGPLEGRILEIGTELLSRARNHKAGLLSAKFYSDKLMEWSMKDQAFKVQFFRFVDAFPTLRTTDAVYEHLMDYMSQPGVTPPAVMQAGFKAGGLAKGIFVSTMTSQIKGMAEKFIAGTDAASALPGLKKMWNDGICFSVDLLGETCLSDAEADAYASKYLDLINNLPGEAATWKADPLLETDHLGQIPRVNVSIKISSLSARCDPIDTEGSLNELMRRLLPILETARDRGVFVNFDMEQFSLKDFTLELFQRCCERVNFQAGLAMQAYLKSGPEDAKRICDWARAKKRLVSVRLVKGAYWDYQTIHAEQMGWPCPVWAQKWQTDACFERMAQIFLDACPRNTGEASGGGVKLALGSHNARSIAATLAHLDARGLPRNALELQMLHGMADQLKYAATEMGLRIREYVPVGEMIPGMAYLVRRLLENTSNESWLKAGFMDNADPNVLLRAPGPVPPPSSLISNLKSPSPSSSESSAPSVFNSPSPATPQTDLLTIAPERHKLSPAIEGLGNSRAFFNESFRDFSDAKQRSAFADAIARATVPKISNDRTPDQARDMVARAHAAFPLWRDTDARTRARVLILAAEAMRRQRDALSGVMIKEAGKTWREADADVCEAIDFCEYYARFAIPLFDRQRLGRFIGELDEQWHQPRGVAVVISPWNFPLAICCGMTVAALVTGNPVIVKPAEQTPGIASIMHHILIDALDQVLATAPKSSRGQLKSADLIHFCPAPGETTGASLVRDPRIALIAFTGSMHVGLDILNASAPPSPFTSAQSPVPSAFKIPMHVKKVICEMGGKNAIIIDTTADFDEAVLGVRHSAFGFQGQKCSACSRVIVVDPEGPDGAAIKLFTLRFVEASRALVIGDPVNPGTDVGPVIDAESKAKITRYIELGKKECRLELSLPVPPGLEEKTGRHFVGPHIFGAVPADHALANEEIFGPVVAIIHAKSYEHALEIANSTPYKLTGAVYSRKPSHLDLAKQEFRVGNLYLNRGSTGALVARQPFGGFGMSGTGSKAGGAEYLLNFVEPRTSCENAMRRGFAPEL